MVNNEIMFWDLVLFSLVERYQYFEESYGSVFTSVEFICSVSLKKFSKGLNSVNILRERIS